MDEEEVTAKVYLDEDNSSQTPKKIKLVQLLDMKEKNISIIQAYLIELKLEKECMSATVNKETKNLEYATQIHRALLSYSTNVKGHLVVFSLNPIMHHEYKTTEPLVLSIHPCLVCKCMFHCCDIIVVFCKCMYHAWCLGFHM
jgi:hypothetical protein